MTVVMGAGRLPNNSLDLEYYLIILLAHAI